MDQVQIETWLKGLFREVLREEMQTASRDDQLLTADQVKETLGLKNTRSVYRLGREKILTPVKTGKNRVRFRRSEVQQYIANASK